MYSVLNISKFQATCQTLKFVIVVFWLSQNIRVYFLITSNSDQSYFHGYNMLQNINFTDIKLMIVNIILYYINFFICLYRNHKLPAVNWPRSTLCRLSQTDSVSERVEIVALCYIAYLNVYFILNQVGTYFNNSSILFFLNAMGSAEL